MASHRKIMKIQELELIVVPLVASAEKVKPKKSSSVFLAFSDIFVVVKDSKDQHSSEKFVWPISLTWSSNQHASGDKGLCFVVFTLFRVLIMTDRSRIEYSKETCL